METVVEHPSKEKPELLMPSGTAIMGWHYASTWNVKFSKNAKKIQFRLPRFYVAGQQSVSYTLSVHQRCTGIIGAALKPTGLWNLFGVPVHRFTNAVVPVEELVGKESLPFFKRYSGANSSDDRLDCMIAFLRQQVKEKKVTATLVDDALEIIFRTRGCTAVKVICDQLKIGERSLQRFFKDQVGVSPLQYIKIIRFNNIFTELAKTEDKPDIQFLSAAYGYYDLAHFSKEFKQFCGVPPSAFMLEKFSLLKELIEDQPYLLEVQSSTAS